MNSDIKKRVWKARVFDACRFYGRDDAWSTFTVYDQDYVVSYAHNDHEPWEINHRTTVSIHGERTDEKRSQRDSVRVMRRGL